MRLPTQARPVLRRLATAPGRCGGVTPQGCGIGEGIKCGAEFVGVTAACATVETGVGVAACIASAIGFVADCHDCITGAEKDVICGAAWVAKQMNIPIGPLAGLCHL